MKFKIDENLPAEYAEELQSAGHDAQTVRAESLTGNDDSVLFDHCKGEDRILITLDLEFGNVQSYPPRSHPGIVVLRPASQDKKTLLSLLQRLCKVLAVRPVAGQLWVVESDRIRSREH